MYVLVPALVLVLVLGLALVIVLVIVLALIPILIRIRTNTNNNTKTNTYSYYFVPSYFSGTHSPSRSGGLTTALTTFTRRQRHHVDDFGEKTGINAALKEDNQCFQITHHDLCTVQLNYGM